MDNYKILGLTRSASKEDIKQAFRKLAMEFHPDKHAHSPQQLKENATLKFKQVSEAYETLIDDRKRADYNIHQNSYRNSANNYYSGGNSDNYYRNSYQNSYRNNHGYGYGYSRPANGGSASAFTKLEMVMRFMNTRAFLLNAALAGILLGATYAVDAGGEALWKMQNSGKSFEEAMESVEKAKAFDDKR
ncbi:PREDICTED: chaperone protein dnaJ 72 [Nicotiana attenuata]|uniref:Chaperone protein dnaj 72 n=1 Tax=Nicotiana attenuata TaxID=49451 RepID=A0A314L861_NICAT|nr:PREDICTED: chaperone protein dnaJ 72 [Nicotiana attenuata]OIT37307.1 chaperone protein dnaj 72 [Nicotiana attenuata]